MFNRVLLPTDGAVLTVFNYHNNFETSNTHALSYGQLSEMMGPKHPTIIGSIHRCIDKEYLKKKIRGDNQANVYRVIHHNCVLGQVPLDRDGRPKKCGSQEVKGRLWRR